MNPFSAEDFVIAYILLPVFVIFVLSYKFWKKTKIVKLAEMDIWSGRREYSQAELDDKPRTLWQRVKSVATG